MAYPTKDRRLRESPPPPPGDAPFRIDALEITQQQHPKVTPRLQTRPPQNLVIEGGTEVLHKSVKAVGGQNLIEALIERMPRRPRQIRRRHEQRLLPRLLSAHRHADPP